MLLTITSTARPATDLGFLLHKHPDKTQSFDVSAGQAHVFYPEASETRCTAALLLEVDPIGLVRGRRSAGPDAVSLAQYVRDRPAPALPREIRIPPLPCQGGPAVAERLFGPLGWTVEARPVPLDPLIPQWGDSRDVGLRLGGGVGVRAG